MFKLHPHDIEYWKDQLDEMVYTLKRMTRLSYWKYQYRAFPMTIKIEWILFRDPTALPPGHKFSEITPEQQMKLDIWKTDLVLQGKGKQLKELEKLLVKASRTFQKMAWRCYLWDQQRVKRKANQK